MKLKQFLSAFVGGLIGSVAVIVVLAIINRAAPMETKDLLSFVLTTVSIVIASVTVIGAVVLVMTWNDIDNRTGQIVTKYEAQAKKNIDEYREDKEVELEKNAKERQEAIDNSAERVTAAMDQTVQGFKKSIWRNTWLLGAVFLLNFLYLFWHTRMIEKKINKKLED